MNRDNLLATFLLPHEDWTAFVSQFSKRDRIKMEKYRRTLLAAGAMVALMRVAESMAVNLDD